MTSHSLLFMVCRITFQRPTFRPFQSQFFPVAEFVFWYVSKVANKLVGSATVFNYRDRD